MVVEWLVDVLASVLVWVVGLFPTLTLPTFLTGSGSGDLVGLVGGLVGSVGMVDAWLPVSQLSVMVGLSLAAYLTAVTVKVIRIVASFLTAGGGSAA